MELRRSSLPLAVVAALALAACGGGSSGPSGADTDRQIDNALDNITELAEEIATTAPEEPASTEPEPAAEPEEADPETEEADAEPDEGAPVALVARCANSVGEGAQTEFEDVDCDGSHDAEYASTVEAPEGLAPGDDTEFDILLTSGCFADVEELVGQPLIEFGLEIAYLTESLPGDTFSGEVECWARSSAFGALSASLRDVDLPTALGDFVSLGSVPVGECYLPAADNNGSVSIGTLVDCSEVYADQIIGAIAIDDDEFPGADALFARGDAECPALAAEADFEISGDTQSAIVPFETEWSAYGIREIVCTSYRAADYEIQAFCGLSSPDDGYEDVPCDEPHDSEFVGPIAPPDGALPDNAVDAELLLDSLCAPIVSEYLGGRDLSQQGVGVGATVQVGLGDDFDGDVDCWAVTGSPGALIGSIAELGLDGAFGDLSVIGELEPGVCFTFAPDAFDLGNVVTCDTPEALMAVGEFVNDDGPHPGDDALREIRFERCSEILAASGLSADPASVSGTFPSANGWATLGRRTTTCDATPL